MSTHSMQITGFWIMLFVVGAASAQTKQTDHTLKLDNPDQRGKATLADASWLQGYWKGEGMGGQCDELWSGPAAGAMVGTFRIIKNDKLLFSEYMMLVEDQGSLVLKIKHFDPEMKGWEEKDKFLTFPLVKVEKDAVYFSGLTYRKNADGSLTIYLAMKRPTGLTEEKFQFKPASSKP